MIVTSHYCHLGPTATFFTKNTFFFLIIDNILNPSWLVEILRTMFLFDKKAFNMHLSFSENLGFHFCVDTLYTLFNKY